ncbi:unnamed protein product [Thelazia callipaeda]|uniref:SERTA domain-containing protein n=1 Tax=Thelazia callipaeda TaxID=103827 RepID=A0A0N5D923_THECL|nr:unnamed protein product [Thelazia callipaeda]
MYPVNDVDEIIETEVCNRLIRLSCAKMVSSKTERGGAKLHRNLLILHLLRKARDEQKRFPMFSNEVEWAKESTAPESPKMLEESNLTSSLDAYSSSQYLDVSGDNSAHMMNETKGEGSTHLLDLSRSHEPMPIDIGDDFDVKQEQSEFEYSPFRLSPLHYAFSAPELYGVNEVTATQQHMYGESASLSDVYFSEQMISSQPLINELPDEMEAEEFPKERLISDSDYSSVSTDAVVPPYTETSSNDEFSPYASDEDYDDEEGSGSNSFPPKNYSHRRRKRKTSALRVTAPCNAKKCCVEERQLTGLISVFNSGLSVVADQLLAHPASSAVSPLQQSQKQINPFMHITCNSVIC